MKPAWVRWSVVLLWVLSGLQLLNMARGPFLSRTLAVEKKPDGTAWTRTYRNHWDFDVYYAAGVVYRNGGNPLDLNALKAANVDIPYNYSPAFTRATMWTMAGEKEAVERRFIAAKLLSIVAGFLVLVAGLPIRGPMRAVAAFLVTFGFGSALLVDVSAGNVTAFEFLVMSVLVVAAYRRIGWAFLLTFFLLCFGKPIWGIFAAVPVLLHFDRRAWRLFAAAAATWFVPFALSLAISVPETKQYLRAILGFRENGWVNPCLREVVQEVGVRLGLGARLGTLAWLLIAISIAAWVYVERRRIRDAAEGIAFGSWSILLLPLLLQRFKPYALALLIPFLLLRLAVAPPDFTRLRTVLFSATAPFVAMVNVPFIFAWQFYGSGLLHWLGYFPLISIVATAFVLERKGVTEAGRSLRALLTHPWRRRIAFAAVVLFAAMGLFRGGRSYAAMERASFYTYYSPDMKTYSKAAEGVRKGGIPYRDFNVEYPPTAAYVFATPGTGNDVVNRQEYAARFMTFMGALLAALMIPLSLLLIRRGGLARGGGAALATAFLFVNARELTFVRFDALVALLLALGGLLAYGSRRAVADFLGGVLLALAGGLKLSPLLLIPGIRPKNRTAWAAGIALGLLPTVVLVLLGPGGTRAFLGYHSLRGIEYGSLWGTLGRWIGPWWTVDAFGSTELRFALAPLFARLSTVATLAAALIPLYLAWRAPNRAAALRWAIVALAGFVLFNKVGSPQYVLWLLAASLIAVGDGPRAFWPLFGAGAVATLAATDAIVNFNPAIPGPMANFADLKVLATAVFFGVAIWEARRAARVPVPAP